MKFMWLRFSILHILNKIWPPEQPTTEELLGQINVLQRELRKYQEREEQVQFPAQMPTMRLPNGATVYIDPAVYQYPQTAAYDAPSPTTDGKIRAERMETAPPVVSPMRQKGTLRKLVREIHPLPEDTQYDVPTFLKDQARP